MLPIRSKAVAACEMSEDSGHRLSANTTDKKVANTTDRKVISFIKCRVGFGENRLCSRRGMAFLPKVVETQKLSFFFNEEIILFMGKSNNFQLKTTTRMCIFSNKVTYVFSHFLVSLSFFNLSPLYGEIWSEHLLSN